MFFIFWGNTDAKHKDVYSGVLLCNKCSSQTKHTFRVYESKLKAYSVIPVSTSQDVTAICHNCLSEWELEKKLRKEMLEKFKKMNLI